MRRPWASCAVNTPGGWYPFIKDHMTWHNNNSNYRAPSTSSKILLHYISAYRIHITNDLLYGGQINISGFQRADAAASLCTIFTETIYGASTHGNLWLHRVSVWYLPRAAPQTARAFDAVYVMYRYLIHNINRGRVRGANLYNFCECVSFSLSVSLHCAQSSIIHSMRRIAVGLVLLFGLEWGIPSVGTA